MRLILNGVDVTVGWSPDENEQTRIVKRAWRGEYGLSTIVALDTAGTLEPYAGQQCKVTDGPTTLIDGYIASVTTRRGGYTSPARIHVITFTDKNALFQGQVVWRYRRPIETDRARVIAFKDFLLPSLSNTWILNEATRNLAAKVYNTDDPWNELLQDVGDRVQKTLFISDDIHYHLPTTGELSLFRILDTLTEPYAAPSGAIAADWDVGNNGIYTGSIDLAETGPLALDRDAAAEFTGGYVTIPEAARHDFTTGLTLEGWAKWTVGIGVHTMVRRAPSANEWWIRADTVGSPLVEFGLNTGSLTQLRYSAVAYNDGFWHHIAATYDGTTMRLYVDGLEKANTPKTGSVVLAADGSIGIGGTAAGAEVWTGHLKDLSINNAALSPSETLADYQRGTGVLNDGYASAIRARSSLRGFWRLGDRYRFVPHAELERHKEAPELRNDIRAANQAGRWKRVTDSTSMTRHDAAGLKHQALLDAGELKYDRLDEFAARVLAQSKDERVGYTARIGPIPAANLGQLQAGQRMTVTSQLFGLTNATARITELALTPAGSPGEWYADLDLEYPKARRIRPRIGYRRPRIR